MQKESLKNSQLILLFIGLFSGATIFIYEVIWMRLLSLTFGTTTTASAIVIATFMAGLGLGGLYWGRVVDRIKKKTLFLSLIEFGIGLSGLLILFILPHLSGFYKLLYNKFHTQSMPLFIISISAFIIIFLPTMLMGGILPVLVKLYVHTNNRIGPGIGILYTTISVGGIIGAGLTGTILIRNLGQFQTQILAIAINLAMGLITLLFLGSESTVKNEKEIEIEIHRRDSLLLLAVATITGFIGLALEIFWLRALSIFLANTAYTFAVVLVVYLLGISIGGYLYTRCLSQTKRGHIWLVITLSVIGGYVIATAFLLNGFPDLLFPLSGLLKIALLRITLPGLVLALVIMFLPALFMGISFPLICRLNNRSLQTLGQGIGDIYFLNTMGSIIGSVSAGFLLIPILGVVRGIIIIGIIYILTAATVYGIHNRKRWTLFIVASGMALTVLLSLGLNKKNTYILPPSIFRTPAREDRILYYSETSSGTVIVTEDRYTGIRACYINNSAVCGVTYDALKVVKMLGELPFLFNPEAETALVIGFGIGITSSTIAWHPVKRLDCVEICPGVKPAAKYFARFNRNIVHNPKVNFIAGDGRNYLLLTDKKYDIISCDPTHPALGCGSLYTLEFFRLCKAHLNQNGVIAQYLPLHKLSNEEFKTAVKTFATVFPHTTIWLAHSHGILLGTPKKVSIDFQKLKNVLFELADDILNDPYLFASSIMLDEDAVKELTQAHPINTDNRPYLEYFTPQSIIPENWTTNLKSLISLRSNPQNVIKNIEDSEKFFRYLRGQEYFLKGLIAQNRRDIKGVIHFFKKALEVNPENNEIEIFLHHILSQYYPKK